MSDGIYVGMSGAVARAEQLDAISDNLANAQTPGFKAARPSFETFLAANDSESAQTNKVFTGAVKTGVDLRNGYVTHTGNPLDLNAEDGAFFAVRTQQGQPAFTRDGHVTVSSAGQLLSGDHLLLNAHGNPITVRRDAHVSVNPRGVVMVNGEPQDELARVRLQGGMQRIGPALIVPDQDGRAVPSDAGVRSGELELGNANPLEATVAMVSAQRNYETAMQAIQTYATLDDHANDIGKVH